MCVLVNDMSQTGMKGQNLTQFTGKNTTLLAMLPYSKGFLHNARMCHNVVCTE